MRYERKFREENYQYWQEEGRRKFMAEHNITMPEIEGRTENGVAQASEAESVTIEAGVQKKKWIKCLREDSMAKARRQS